MPKQPTIAYLLACLFLCVPIHAQDPPKKMPREDVVDVAAIGKGL